MLRAARISGPRAIVALLTGRIPATGDAYQLYFVRSDDSDRAANRQSLGILLRLVGGTWSAVQPELFEPLPLPRALVEKLRVKAVDLGVLHELLRESLDEVTDWSPLEKGEVLHLLRRLHGTGTEDRARWRAMPLHRLVGGGRGSFDDRAHRAVGGLRLPPELESEIRVLEPDAEVTGLYLDVRVLDDDGILSEMLRSPRPDRFANQVVRALRPNEDGRVVLPRDSGLLDRLRDAAWMPHRDKRSALAPSNLLMLPRELQQHAAPLVRAGTLGDYGLVNDVGAAFWEVAEDVVREVLGRPTNSHQVRRLAGALDPSKVAGVEAGAYSLLSDAARLDAALIDDAINSPLANSHRGWALVRAAAAAVGIDSRKPISDAPATTRDVVVGLARALCVTVPAAHKTNTSVR